MNIKLLTEHHLEFLSLKRGCTGLSESTFVKMPHCWKSHVTAHILREKSLAIYFEDSQFRRNRAFNFIVLKIYVDKRSRVR